MALPTADEINVYDSLDEREACKNYLGKSLEEVRQMLDSGIGNYWEDLAWMGPKAFYFYLPTVIEIVQSEMEKGVFIHISEFLTLTDCRMTLDQDSVVASAGKLMAVCREIAANLPRLASEDIEISRLPRIMERLAELLANESA